MTRPIEYVSGGNRSRWIVVPAGFLFVILVWAPYSGLATFFPLLAEDLGTQRGTIAIAFTIIIAIGAPFGVVIGRLLDGPWAHRVALLEVLLCGLGYLLASTMQSIWQLYVYLGFLLGAGFAGGYIIPTTVVARWFEDKRGLAVGVVLSGTGVGYLVGPLVAVNLMQGFGWRGALAIFGSIASLLAILPALMLRNPPSATAAQPAALSGTTSQQADGRGSAHSGSGPGLREALGTSTFWMLFVVWVLQALPIMMFTIHVVPLIVDKGIGITAAAGALSLYGAGILCGRILSGQAADRFGGRSTLVLTTAIAAASLVLLLVTQDLTLLYASSIAFGFASSGADTAYVKILPDIVGTRALGTVLSGVSFGWRLGGGIGPALAGFLFDATHIYALPVGLAVFGLLVSILLFLWASRPEQRLAHVLERNGARG